MDTRQRRLLAWVSLVIVYLVWGSTYLAIRVGVRDLPPVVLVGARYLVAGALLFPVARHASASGPRERLGARQWGACGVVGALLLVVGNGGVTLAERSVPSGLAAVLVATVPLWMIGFAIPIRHERLTVRAAAGVVLGVIGVGVLAGVGSAGGDATAEVIVLVAAAGWALGSVLAHVLPLPRNALVAASMQMLLAGAALVLAGLLSGVYQHTHWSDVSAQSWWALAWLVVPGSVLAFGAYAFALSELPLSVVGTYAYVNPVVAVVLGTLLLDEHFSGRQVFGTVIVIVSVALTLHRTRPAASVTASPAPARTDPPDPDPYRAGTSRELPR